MPCGASYAFNTIVTLTAVPDPGSTFAGWGGGCANVGTNPTCAVGLPGDRFAFAYFTKTPGTVATTYYHTDAIGSVRALSDQTGATVIQHDYLPFGEDTQPLAGDPMRFAGKELDPESALMNFEAHYYRNTWGRFTQVDPASGTPADPQSWNRYAYARNNPLRFVDPTGLCGEPVTESSSYTGTHLDVNVNVPIPCDAGTYNGSDMWSERNGMTPSPGDLGPFGCGYIPDSNGNFYRWLETCDHQASQQVADTPAGEAGNGGGGNGGGTDIGGGTGAGGGTNTPTTPTAGHPAKNRCAPGDLWCQLATDIWNRASPITEPSSYAWFYGGSIAGGAAGLGVAQVIRFALNGWEISIGDDFRLAPFGNRTGNRLGRIPHYHRRIFDPDGAVRDGGGIGRHRPWEAPPPGKPWWWRF
jgi:RHS repeat-associated protein